MIGPQESAHKGPLPGYNGPISSQKFPLSGHIWHLSILNRSIDLLLGPPIGQQRPLVGPQDPPLAIRISDTGVHVRLESSPAR